MKIKPLLQVLLLFVSTGMPLHGAFDKEDAAEHIAYSVFEHKFQIERMMFPNPFDITENANIPEQISQILPKGCEGINITSTVDRVSAGFFYEGFKFFCVFRVRDYDGVSEIEFNLFDDDGFNDAGVAVPKRPLRRFSMLRYWFYQSTIRHLENVTDSAEGK